MNLRRFVFLLLAACALSPPALAQKSGSITSTQCISIDVTAQSTVGIQVTGTWSGTLQPEISVQGQAPANMQVTPSTSSTAQSTITANGVYQAKVAGGSTFLLCGATVGSGTANVYLNSSQGVAVIIPPGNPGTVTNVSGTANQIDVATGTSTPVVSLDPAVQVGSNRSAMPVDLGQLGSTQSWPITPKLSGPALALNVTGGHLSNSTLWVQITYNTALGESLPSAEATVLVQGCTGGNQCSVTVTAPTLLTGYTGYTVYSSTGGAGTELQQAANAACVNITGNCVIQNAGAGAAPPTTNTSYAHAHTFTNLCPAGIQPTGFIQRADGSFVSQSGIDTVTGGVLPSPIGTYTLCNRLFLNDYKLPIFIKNALMSIYHLWGAGTTTTTSADDRALAIRIETPSTLTGNQGNSRIEGIYGETGILGAPTGFGSGTDQGQDGIRWVIDDQHTSALTTPSRALTGTYSYSGSGTYTSINPCCFGVMGELNIGGTTNFGGEIVVAVGSKISNVGGSGSFTPINFYAPYMTGTSPGQYAFYIPGAGWGTNSGDKAWVNDGISPSHTAGTWSVMGLKPNAQGTVPLTGSFTGAAAFSTAQLAAGGFTNGTHGTPGITSYSYVICSKDAAGGAICSGTGTVSTGNATLDGTNYNILNITSVAGVQSWDVYRTASGGTPSSTGKIGNVVNSGVFRGVASGSVEFDDKGLAGDSTTPPVGNTTGEISGAWTNTAGLFGTAQNQTSAICETAGAPTVLSTSVTATTTGLSCLPANSVLDAVVYRITTGITGTTASFTIGDGTIATRFCGTQSTVTIGTTGICFAQADQTGTSGPRQVSAAAMVVTTDAAPTAGAIRLIVFYHTWTPPTS